MSIRRISCLIKSIACWAILASRLFLSNALLHHHASSPRLHRWPISYTPHRSKTPSTQLNSSLRSQLEQLSEMTTLSIDSGDLLTIEEYAKTGFITDSTTNPLFVSQAGLSGDPLYAKVRPWWILLWDLDCNEWRCDEETTFFAVITERSLLFLKYDRTLYQKCGVQSRISSSCLLIAFLHPTSLYNATCWTQLVDDAVEFARTEGSNFSEKDVVSLAIDRLAVNLGAAIAKIVPGYISTEVDPRCVNHKDNRESL